MSFAVPPDCDWKTWVVVERAIDPEFTICTRARAVQHHPNPGYRQMRRLLEHTLLRSRAEQLVRDFAGDGHACVLETLAGIRAETETLGRIHARLYGEEVVGEWDADHAAVLLERGALDARYLRGLCGAVAAVLDATMSANAANPLVAMADRFRDSDSPVDLAYSALLLARALRETIVGYLNVGMLRMPNPREAAVRLLKGVGGPVELATLLPADLEAACPPACPPVSPYLAAAAKEVTVRYAIAVTASVLAAHHRDLGLERADVVAAVTAPLARDLGLYALEPLEPTEPLARRAEHARRTIEHDRFARAHGEFLRFRPGNARKLCVDAVADAADRPRALLEALTSPDSPVQKFFRQRFVDAVERTRSGARCEAPLVAVLTEGWCRAVDRLTLLLQLHRESDM